MSTLDAAAPTAPAWARALIEATTLDGKLVRPPRGATLDDASVGAPPRAPGRPEALRMRPGREVSVPPLAGMRDPAQRARILHALANHELQAAELFAWALLAFPEAPAAFRGGLVAIAAEEQAHLDLYIQRLAAHGLAFGDQPVTGHFWNHLPRMTSPLSFVCAMGLTFENANLDFAGDYAAAARDAGDVATAEVLEQVHADELGHVAFAWTWLARLAPDQDPWEAYVATAEFPLGPHRARGRRFDAEARRRAGLSPDFIARLAAIDAKRPGGAAR